MKLHLPHGLRKALLACMASFALAMPTTLATASGTDAAFAEFQLLSVPQAAAVDVGYGEDAPDARDETEWLGEIEKEFELSTPLFGEIAGDKPVVIADAVEYTWTAEGSDASFTWNAESESLWSNSPGAEATDGNSTVTMNNANAAGGAEVTLSGMVAAGNLILGGGHSFTFNAAEVNSWLVLSGGLTLEENTTLVCSAVISIAEGLRASSASVTLSGVGELMLMGAEQATMSTVGNLTVGAGSTVWLAKEQSLSVTGTLSLGAGQEATLIMQNGTLAADTLVVEGGVILELDMTGTGSNLNISHLTFGQDGSLTITLTKASYDEWRGGHPGETETYQLFAPDTFATFSGELNGGNITFKVADTDLYVTLDDTGALTFSTTAPEPPAATSYTWTAAADAGTFSWVEAGGGTAWDEGGTDATNAGSQVTMNNAAVDGGVTVTLSGAVKAGSLTLKGAHGFTLGPADGSGTLTLEGGMTMGELVDNNQNTGDSTTLVCNATVTVGEKFEIRSGRTQDVLVVDGANANLKVTGDIVTSGGDSGTIRVVGGGSLTAAQFSGISNGNTSFFGHGHAPALLVGDENGTGTVTIGTEGGTADALLQVRQLVVKGAESSVTVWGNLSSAYSNNTSSITGGTVTVSGNMVQQGALTIDGGTLEVGGYYANASSEPPANGGAITLSNGGRMSVGGGLHSSAVTLGAGTELAIGGNALTVNTLTAEAGATLTVTLTDGNTLDITQLTLGGGVTLSIKLTGYAEWAAGHEGVTTYQLFNTEHFNEAWNGSIEFEVDGQPDVGVTMDTTGLLTFSGEAAPPGPEPGGSTTFTWTPAAGTTTFTWDAANGEGNNTWTEGEGATGTGSQVAMDNTAVEGGTTVTLSGEVQAGRLTLKGGHGFTFAAAESGGSLTLADGMTMEGNATTLSCNAAVTVGGGLSIASGGTENVLVVNGANASLTVTGDIVVQGDTGTIKVAGGGSLKAASLAGGSGGDANYFSHAHASKLFVGEENSTGEVTVGTEGGTDALLQVRQLTVIGAASKVTVWGNLSSSWGDASSITGGTVKASGAMVQKGALTVDGGTLEVGGYYAGSSQNTTSNGGNITLSNGGSMSVGGGLHSSAVTLNGGGNTLTLTDATQATASAADNMTVGAGSTVVLGAQQSLSVTGTLGIGGATVTMQGGTLTVGTLDASAGGATLTLTLTDGNNLDISHLTLGQDGQLTVTLTGYDAWANAHPGEEEYQLFNAERFGALWGELSANGGTAADFFKFVVEGEDKLRVTLSETGALTFGGAEFRWEAAAGADTFTWDATNGASSSTPWTSGEGKTDTKAQVTMDSTAAEGGATVVLSGEVQARSLTLTGGHGFTLRAAGGDSGSLTLAGGLTLGENTALVCNVAVNVGADLIITSGNTENVFVVDGANVAVSGNIEVQGGDGGTMKVVGGGSLTAASISGGESGQNSHASALVVGDDSGAGAVTVGTQEASNALLQVKRLEVAGEGSRVAVWGDLSTGDGDASSITGGTVEVSGNMVQGTGALTVDGGELTVGGNYTGTADGGDIALRGGGRMSVGGGVDSSGVTLEGEGSTLTVADAAQATTSTVGSMSMGAGSTVVLGAQQSLSVTGTLSMGGATLTMQDGTLTADTLDATAGGAGLALTMTNGGNNLGISHLKLGVGGKLHITLSGYGSWAAEHIGEDYQLFNEESFTALWNELSGGNGATADFFEFTVEGQPDGLKYTLSGKGALTFSGAGSGFTWKTAAGVATFTWDAEKGATGTPWTYGQGATSETSPVVMTNDEAEEAAEVTLSGDVRAKSLVLRGAHGFRFLAAEGGGTQGLTLAEGLTLHTTLDSNVEINVGTDLTITSGNTEDVLVVEGAKASLTVRDIVVEGDTGTIKVVGGGSLKAASLAGVENEQNGDYFLHGHAPALIVGEGDDSTGTVTVGTEESGGLLQVRQLVVNGQGSRVTVWGDLSSAYQSNTSSITGGTVTVSGNMVQQGELTVDGGTLTVGGYYANASSDTPTNGGAITLSNGGSVSVGGGLHTSGVTLSGEGSTLTLTGEKQSNTVGGALTLGTGTSLELLGGTLTADTLDASAGGATLTVTMTADGNNLDIKHLTAGEGETLTVTLTGYEAWVAGQTDEQGYQLFNATEFDAGWRDSFTFRVEGNDLLRGTLTETGAVTFEKMEGYEWEAAAGRSAFTWDGNPDPEGAAEANQWTVGSGTTGDRSVVKMTNRTVAGGATVTITGAVQAWNVSFEGEYGFTLVGIGGGTLTLTGDLAVNTGLVCDADVTVEGGVSGTGNILVGSGASGNLTVTGGGTVDLKGWLSVAGGAFRAENSEVRLGGGLSSDLLGAGDQHRKGGTVTVKSLETTVNEGEMTFEGELKVTETLTKKGAGTQALSGGGGLSIGSIDVQGGTLHIEGGGQVTKTAEVSGEGSLLEWQGGAVTTAGVTLSNGGQAVFSDGGVTVSGDTTVSGAGSSMKVTGGNMVTTNAAVSDGGQLVLADGNFTMNGTTTVSGEGSSVSVAGDMGITPSNADVLVVNGANASLTVTGSIVEQGDAGTMKVAGGGSLTAASISGTSGGDENYFAHGHASALLVGDENSTGTVTVGTEGGTDALLQVRQLVVGEGSSVTVWGDLSSSYRDASSITGGTVTVSGNMVQNAGALTIDGGTLEVGGYYAGSSQTTTTNGGDITLSNGGRMSVGGGVDSSGVTLEGEGSTLTVADAAQATTSTVGSMSMGAGSTVVLGAQQSLRVTGTLSMGGATLTMQGGTLTADTLDATAGGAGLALTMTNGGNNLGISHLKLGVGGKLHITLSGYGSWAAEHIGEDYQLFNEESFTALWNELSGGNGATADFFEFTVEGQPDSFMSYTLTDTGAVTRKPSDGLDPWVGSEDGVWYPDEGDGKEDGNWTGARPGEGTLVTFGESAAKRDVQLAGDVKVRGVQIESGEFTFASSENGGSLAANELIVLAGARLNLQTTLQPKGGTEEGGSMVVVLEGSGENLGKLDVREGSVLGEGVKVQFKGGALVLSAAKDVSGNVDADGSIDAVKVEVADQRQWGNTGTLVNDNGGLTLALGTEGTEGTEGAGGMEGRGGKGLEKSGAGEFTLAWQGDEQEHAGALTVKEGTLTLAVGGEKATQLSGNITGAGKLAISEGNVTLSGSNTVGEIELGGGTTTITGTGALGGASTTLILSGGALTGDGATAGAGTVKVSKDTVVSGVTLSGKVTDSAALTVADGAVAGLSGDVSGYNGTLNTGASGTWKLSGVALTGTVGAAVSGDGTVQFDGAATYGGKVEGNVTLEGLGDGGLTVVSEESSAGAKLKGKVTLGSTGRHAQWSGQEVAAGSSVTLTDVTLAGVGGFTTKAEGVRFYVNTAHAAAVPSVAAADAEEPAVPTGGVVDVNGMDAGKLDGIVINDYGKLTGVSGTYTAGRDKQLELHFTAGNMGETAEDGQALVEGRRGFVLDATSKYDVNLDMSNVVGSILEELTAPSGGEVYLHLLQGGSLTMGELGLDDFEGMEIFESVVKGFSVRVIAGDIVMTGEAENVYMAEGGETVDVSVPGSKKAVVFTAGKSATFTTDSEGTLHNLLGESGSALRLQKGAGATGEVSFVFDNTHADDIVDAESYPEVDRTTVRGQDTKFLGSISGEAGVNVVKDGRGTLTVGGNYALEAGSTTLRHGRLVLQGAENRTDELVFDYNPDEQPVVEGEATESQTEEQRGLVLDRGETFIGTIVEAGTDRNGNEVQLQHGAKLTLSGASTLSGTRIVSGDVSGTLTLQKAAEGAEVPVLSLAGEGEALLSGLTVNVKDGAELTVSGADAAVKSSRLNVENGTVRLAEGAVVSDSSAVVAADSVLDLGGSAANQLTTLSGAGTLKSAAGGAVTVGGGSFSGTLGSSEEGGGAGTLVVAAGADFTLDNVNTTTAASAWGIGVRDGARLTIDVTKKGKGNILTLGDIDLGTGNTVTIRINAETYSAWDNIITGKALTFGANTTVVLDAVVGTEKWNPTQKLTIGKFDSVSDTEDLKVQLKGAAFVLSQVQGVTWGTDHRLEVQLTAYQGNHFADVIPQGEKNVRAGAEMAWNSFNDRIAQGTVGSGDYAMVMTGLSAMLETGNTVGLQRGLAAVAGASIATLAPAFSEDMHRQLTAIRNRTTTMASDVTQETYDKLPLWHAWINAESNYRKLDAEGLAPGYKLNSWGGTAGVDADLNRHLTVGLAVTAMYGDLEAESADSATGDLDTTYLSLFMRATHGSWIHTLVVSCGRADAELNRTIPYGLGTCRVGGSTNGYAYGAMYEVGYTRLVNKRGTAALQPVFNAELRHVSLKGYTEYGSDIGLNTEDTDRTVATFGAGARAQVAVGANAFNRTTVFEARALLKADVGDRSGTAHNAIINDPTRAEVESAEVGAVGVEVGAGLNVPLGAQFGSAFLDGSLEFRDGMTAANATIGYRINF